MKPRKLSPRSLENSALFHLRRHASTVAGLRRVLQRRVARSLREHGGDKAEASAWVEALLVRLEKAGYLDDARFAHSRANSLQRRGLGTRQIQARLRLKGVSPELVTQAVQEVNADPQAELGAALEHARRKKLGPFRKQPSADFKLRAKELASFIRAGFSFSLARRIVDASDPDALRGF